MSIEEVSWHVRMTPDTLRAALSHINDLSYFTIRDAGVELLLLSGSTNARALGFLVDADAFEILELDEEEMRRFAKERYMLMRWFMKTH
jgi:hypothetical protein